MRRDLVVELRCVACKQTRFVRPHEVRPDEMPMCHRCFSPMAAVAAEMMRTTQPELDQ